MTLASAAFAGADPDLLGLKAGFAEAFGEGLVRGRGPDGENAARLQRGARGAQSAQIIEPVVGPARQAFGAVVDVEQDRVIGVFARGDQLPDIARVDFYTRVVERAFEQSRRADRAPKRRPPAPAPRP